MIENISNIAELAHRELSSAKSGEKFSLSAVLTDALGFKKIFVHHEVIPPGRRASAPHAHSSQEEMIFVLRGNPTAYIGDRAAMLAPGDFIGFQPSTEKLHYIENGSIDEAELLMIASRDQSDHVHYDELRNGRMWA